MNYTPNLATLTGTAVLTPGIPGAMTTPRTASRASGTAGHNSATWNPTIAVTVPTDNIVGTYSATLTHSVV